MAAGRGKGLCISDYHAAPHRAAKAGLTADGCTPHRRPRHVHCPYTAKISRRREHPVRRDSARPTMSSTRTAQACHISGDRVAKGIVLGGKGGFMLAGRPAAHHLDLSELSARFGDGVEMANETEIHRLFADCAYGAVPAVGACYGLDLIVDDSIEKQPEIYIEAGDHETLLHLSHAQFARLMANALHGRVSVHD